MNEQHLKQLEAYIQNKLDTENRILFEKEMEKNAELKQLYEEHKLTMEVIDNDTENELRNKFSQWLKEDKRSKTRKLSVISAIAASTLVLFGFFLIKNLMKPKSDYQLALSYYKVPEAPAHEMGDDQIDWQNGLKAYQQKQYTDAIKAWKKIENPDAEASYYLAHALFNTKEFKEAAAIFKLISESSSVYNYHSDWYYLLALLASEDTGQMNKQLNKILSDKSHPYYTKTKELKNNIEKINTN